MSATQTNGSDREDARARQKAETRMRLLDAAAKVYCDAPPMTVPVDIVAQEAGVSKATLFFHFGSRSELFGELASHLYVRGWRDRRGGTRGDLIGFLRQYLHGQRSPEARLIWHLGDLLAAEGSPQIGTAYEHHRSEVRSRVVAMGATKKVADTLTEIVTPAMMLVGRRIAMANDEPGEGEAFLKAMSELLRRFSLKPVATTR